MSGTSSQVQHVVVDDGTCTAMSALLPPHPPAQSCSLLAPGRPPPPRDAFPAAPAEQKPSAKPLRGDSEVPRATCLKPPALFCTGLKASTQSLHLQKFKTVLKGTEDLSGSFNRADLY